MEKYEDHFVDNKREFGICVRSESQIKIDLVLAEFEKLKKKLDKSWEPLY